jgi:hypothetical protein
MSGSGTQSSQVVASQNSDVDVTQQQVGYEAPVVTVQFEYNMIVGVNHSFFANVVTQDTNYLIYDPAYYKVFSEEVFSEIASSHYDLIPNVLCR